MDKKSFIIKAEAVIFAVTLIIVAIVGLLTGKVVEGSVAEEVWKWVLGAIGGGVFMALLLHWPVCLIADRKFKDKK
jgi:VIT1/CCC1 family predicted Fe2+/Mn2+ transporter